MSEDKPNRSTVRRHYLEWRRSRGLLERCDNQQCQFNANPLVWNGQPLGLILDHISGNARDNRPENLRLLCPNCDAQNATTRGGANAGRIEILKGGSYHARNRDGTQAGYANGARLVAAVTIGAGAAYSGGMNTGSPRIGCPDSA
ncbi:HNH endonuclease [Synechococcus sp. CCAP 1479/9]|uniref:HNH endonuclease n=1 Tax=Synechococcus sp. CCAP 1479/9 TaxID=1221593 RepID=UPI0025706CD8|nr:HNH endonuclease [Synechococcus sp. CCAP 1479/9]